MPNVADGPAPTPRNGLTAIEAAPTFNHVSQMASGIVAIPTDGNDNATFSRTLVELPLPRGGA